MAEQETYMARFAYAEREWPEGLAWWLDTIKRRWSRKNYKIKRNKKIE